MAGGGRQEMCKAENVFIHLWVKRDIKGSRLGFHRQALSPSCANAGYVSITDMGQTVSPMRSEGVARGCGEQEFDHDGVEDDREGMRSLQMTSL